MFDEEGRSLEDLLKVQTHLGDLTISTGLKIFEAARKRNASKDRNSDEMGSFETSSMLALLEELNQERGETEEVKKDAEVRAETERKRKEEETRRQREEKRREEEQAREEEQVRQAEIFRKEEKRRLKEEKRREEERLREEEKSRRAEIIKNEERRKREESLKRAEMSKEFQVDETVS